MATVNQSVRLKDSDIVRTCQGRLSYASLFKKTMMKGETNPERAVYSTSLLFQDKADLKALIALVEETAVAKWGSDYKTKFKVKKPFLKVSDYPKMSKLQEEGFTTMVRLATKTQPQVVLANKMAASESDAYSGRWASCTVNAYFYDHPTGGKGVSLGLQNVQLLDHAERLGGARGEAADQFDNLGDVADDTQGGDDDDDIYS